MSSKICSFYNIVFNYIFFGLCCCREKIFSKLGNSKCRCVKSVRIRNFSSTYSARTRENTDQKNFEFEHFSCSVSLFMYFLQRYQGNSRNFLFCRNFYSFFRFFFAATSASIFISLHHLFVRYLTSPATFSLHYFHVAFHTSRKMVCYNCYHYFIHFWR